jgi:protocatechuate 3,4-dioxygenase alpha subunit
MMTQSIQPLQGLTPSQTVGPFFLDCMLRPDMCRTVLALPEALGEHIRVEGRVLDGDGLPVSDALVEVWQANSFGRYNHAADTRAAADLDPGFLGFGRCGTDATGHYCFETVKPGAVPFGDDGERAQAPHMCVIVLARGLLNHLVTRLYFADEPANESDPILRLVPPERRATLIAQPVTAGGRPVYRWDIILQGPGETAFFQL